MVSLAGTIAQDNAHELSRQGYAISEWIGFDVHEIPLYTHHAGTGVVLGDVVFKMRVGNPKSLNNMEANFLARKGAKGYFLWKPGPDCMARTFKDFEFKPRPLGGVERIEHEAHKGCCWCRERQGQTLPTEAVVATGIPPPASTAVPPPSVPTFDVLHCPDCTEVFTGDNAEVLRRGHKMGAHKQRRTTRPRKKRVSTPDSA